MGEIIPSESLSRVTYTEIISMHSQKAKQPYIRSARKNRTRKKSAVKEDPRKSLEKNKKNEPCVQLKSTESLKKEKPKNTPPPPAPPPPSAPQRTKYIKMALKIAKNSDPEDRKAKVQARAEKS